MREKTLWAILTKKIEILFEVVTYAEAGAFESARRVLKKEIGIYVCKEFAQKSVNQR
ncbi:hypothetical protein [Candidatus Desulfofervidus auxilii]|uniref:hypothetical protein n=1 Tax=Desulfofervidus auxilii TaxID=1621989 RepID=UPI0012E796D7|nr:hypothetical protein [Candidatus Desulfofervidus auxilii]